MKIRAGQPLLVVIFVYASTVALSAEPPISQKTKSRMTQPIRATNLELFVKNLLDSGKDDKLANVLAHLHHFEPATPIKFLFVKPDDKNHRIRLCDLILDKSSRKPQCLVLFEQKKVGDDLIGHSYRMKLDGSLESANFSIGKYDASGKIIRGSAVDTQPDPNSESTKQAAQKELGFWMSGEYKKYLTATETKTVASAKLEPGPTAAAPQQSAP